MADAVVREAVRCAGVGGGAEGGDGAAARAARTAAVREDERVTSDVQDLGCTYRSQSFQRFQRCRLDQVTPPWSRLRECGAECVKAKCMSRPWVYGWMSG
jgi:hypothetical protein